MYLGYIVGDEHPLLETISSTSIENRDKPVLIVGMNRAIGLYPELNVSNKKIKENVYYIFSETESDKYEESLNNFLYHCYKNLIKKFTIVKNYLEFENITLSKSVFVFETDLFLTITSGDKVYYIDKKIYNFFYAKTLNTKKLIKQLKELFPDCVFYSWDNYFYFQSYLKTTNYYISLKDFKKLHLFDDKIDLHIGVACLEWVDKFNNLGLSQETLAIWNKAYEVESYLSSLKVRIDKEKILNLEDNIYFSILNNLENEEYLKQAYKGTDKITGRIYSSKKNFNIQNLSKNNRDIVIAEKKCMLLEFDYDYFEYSLLRQLCGLDFSEDPHLKLAKELFNDESYRDVAKRINYSILYGQSISNSIKSLKGEFPNFNLNEEKLQEQLEEFVKPFEETKMALELEFKNSNKIINYFGRNIYPEKEWAYLNNFIQSTAADFLITKIDKLKKYLQQYPSTNRILLQKHDSILFNLSVSLINNTEIVEDIIKILEEPEKQLIAKTSLKFGKNWKDLE